MDTDNLKVTELRDELKARGLDTKGNKAALIQRLKEAMEQAGEDYEAGSQYADNEADVEEATTQEQEELEEDSGHYEEPGVKDAEHQDNMEEAVEEGEDQNGDQQEGQELAEEEEEEEEPAIVLGDEFRTLDETTQDDTQEESGCGDKSRKRSHSMEGHRPPQDNYGRTSPPPKKIEMDDTAWESQTIFNLDRYDADLTLRFNDRGMKAYPLTVDGFAFMWSGVRGTYGVQSGKVAYEVKLLENLNVKHLPKEEAAPHELRVGWSVLTTSLNLGEEPLSFGYGGCGKAVTDGKFVDYGQTFGQGDVITAYVDLDSEPVVLSYAKNGEFLGKCFEVERETLGTQALFPHLMTKNVEFEVNFGGREGPYFPLKEGYQFLEQVPLEDRVRNFVPPASKENCEVIMMVGLPGAGKSYWVKEHVASHPDKQYNILGISSILDKMKVMGEPRKKHFTGRWERLIDLVAKCFTRMVEIAAHKKRNYIIDKTNVYASSRRWKMQPFEGFHRKAVVVLPTDEEFKKRVKERTDEEGKDIPESAVNKMKASFSLPEKGECYESVEYSELDLTKEDREKLIEKYRKEGQEALPPPEKRYRKESRDFREYSRSRSRARRPFRGRSSYRGDFRGGRRPRIRSRGRGYSTFRPPYGERRPRGGYRSRAPREDRRRDDRRDSYSGYSSYRRGGGGWGSSNWGTERDSWGSQRDSWGSQRDSWGSQRDSWGSQRDSWGSQRDSWGSRGGYRQSKWDNYRRNYNQGWDDNYDGQDYDQGYDGYEDDYGRGWGYGYK